MEPWMIKLTEEIKAAVGDKKLPHYQTVILPQIIADFHGMLNKASVNDRVEEEYCMEDGSMKILLCGTKDKTGKCSITSAAVQRG